MAQNTRTWGDLVKLTQARAGAAVSADFEMNNIGILLNSAAHILYNETPWWERYLVLEPRTVSRGYVDYTEDSYNVYGAGTEDVNGLYVRNGTANGVARYSKYDSDGTTILYDIESDASNLNWQILSDADAVLYDIASTASTPPESGWADNTGDSPAPIVQALSEIGEYIGHWNGAKWECTSTSRGSAYPDQNGIRITGCCEGDTVYVAFKKSFSTVFGDGELGTTSDVPAEWFEFMAYHAARSYHESQGRDIQSITLSTIQGVKDQALLKINRQGIYETIARRFKTYYGQDVSVR
jgi:hypothetical protein